MATVRRTAMRSLRVKPQLVVWLMDEYWVVKARA